MKEKIYIIISVMSAICIVFSIMSYRSYNKAYNIYQKQKEEMQRNESVSVEKTKDALVQPDTECVYLTYNAITEDTTESKCRVATSFIAWTREEILSYLAGYMESLPTEEQEKGLVSYELLSFSPEEMVFKKTYNPDQAIYRYYMVVENNEVVVYYSDWKNVYENTGIDATLLPIEEQKKLSSGVKIKNDAELYSILEDYSS